MSLRTKKPPHLAGRLLRSAGRIAEDDCLDKGCCGEIPRPFPNWCVLPSCIIARCHWSPPARLQNLINT